MGLERKETDGTGSFPEVLHRVVEYIPFSSQPASNDPKAKARKLGGIAAMKAAAFSGALSMPPGPLGLLTLIPDLLGIWRIQAQLAADVAAVYGKTGYLTRESMLYCMFRHGAAHAVRDIVIRSGQRLLLRRITVQATEGVLERVGLRLSQRLATKAVSRWLPIVGAVGVGAYAYYDTGEVARTAIEIFSSDLLFDPKSGKPSEPSGLPGS